LLIPELNPQNHVFLTGHLPSVADFEVAYLVDHFKWICEKNFCQNPFKRYPKISNLFNSVNELDGVKEYIQSENKQGKRWYTKGKAIHERVREV